eukprot:1760083-Amphidinium_carterae.1
MEPCEAGSTRPAHQLAGYSVSADGDREACIQSTCFECCKTHAYAPSVASTSSVGVRCAMQVRMCTAAHLKRPVPKAMWSCKVAADFST